MLFNLFKSKNKCSNDFDEYNEYNDCYEYPQKVIKKGVIDQINYLNSKIINFAVNMTDDNLKEIEHSIILLRKSYENLKKC